MSWSSGTSQHRSKGARSIMRNGAMVGHRIDHHNDAVSIQCRLCSMSTQNDDATAQEHMG